MYSGVTTRISLCDRQENNQLDDVVNEAIYLAKNNFLLVANSGCYFLLLNELYNIHIHPKVSPIFC